MALEEYRDFVADTARSRRWVGRVSCGVAPTPVFSSPRPAEARDTVAQLMARLQPESVLSRLSRPRWAGGPPARPRGPEGRPAEADAVRRYLGGPAARQHAA
jgi:hypothetical protein